jgi:hypothetical protein
MDANELVATRRSFHSVAELIMAGPQYRRSGTIRLKVTPGGFGTISDPELRVEGHELVAGGDRLPLDGATIREIGSATGVEAGAPENLYKDGSGASVDDVLAAGDAALRALAPAQTPVLWPEHFDLGITIDEVNYGVSLGDGYIEVPYAYVGPWKPRTGDFWNAPFGAARPLGELQDLAGFFEEGRRRAADEAVAGDS